MSLIEIALGLRPNDVRAPPSVKTVSCPCVSTAVTTATRWGHCVGLEAVTRTTGAPSSSSARLGSRKVRTTLPRHVSVERPLVVSVTCLVEGRRAKLAVFPLQGSEATWTGLSLSTPFGMPLRNRSYQRVDSSRTCTRSGPGKLDG